MHPLVERVDALLNPLMVKEAHQSFRNRSLLIMGVLVLGIPLLTFMGTAASNAVNTSDSSGETFFRTLSGFVVFVTWLALPARLAAQFHGEVKTRTIELTMLTGLTPWQQASGRFQAGVLQVLLLLAFVGPFAVASIAMGGIGADRVLPELLLIFVVALMQCAGALLAVTATLLAPRLLALFALVAIVELFTAVSIGVSFTSMAASSGSALELLLWSSVIGVITLFFVRLSADMLAPSGTRSYFRSKLLMVLVLALYSALPLLAALFSITSSPNDEPYLFMGSSWLCGFGLLWAGGDRRPGSAGKLGFVFEDGPESTALYVCLLGGMIAMGAQRAGWDAWIALAFLVYFVLFVGLGALLQSLWFARNPEGFFIGVLIVILTNLITTFIVAAEGGWSFNDHPSRATLLLPFVWATSQQRVLDPWIALPLLIGVAALFWVRQRRRKLQHG
jgi:hypothetical protein